MIEQQASCRRVCWAAKMRARIAQGVAFLLLAAGAAILSPAARALTADESLAAGISAYQAAEYSTAIERFRGAVAQPDALAPRDRALAFMYLGAIYTLRGITADATPNFEACVSADPDFQPDEEIFNLAQRQAWEGARDRLAGQIEIRSEPAGAAVRVDGREVGETPHSGWALLGTRGIEIEKPGYRPVSLSLAVRTGSVARPSSAARLEEARGTLSVEIDPPEALIRVNDGRPERGPIARDVPTGSYVISGVLEGFVGESQSFVLKDGERREISLRLSETREHAAARVERELREQAQRIRSGKARSKTLLSVLCLSATAAGAASGVVFQAQATESFDAYSAAVAPEEIDRQYSDYESSLTLSRISFGAAGGMLVLSVLQLLRHTPTVDEVLIDLKRSKGLAWDVSAGPDEGLRVSLSLR